MAYKVIILYRLYMPSYFLGTFTEYPYLVLIDSNNSFIEIYLINQSKIPTFTPLEQGKFLSEKHRNEAGAELGAFLGRLL